MYKKLITKKWFSVAGAKRGGIASLLLLSIWMAWAYGYVQGITEADQVIHTVGLELKPMHHHH